MLRDCSSHNDYSQALPRFNQKRLEKCSAEKAQPYQPKPVEVETVDPNRTRPNCLRRIQTEINEITVSNYFSTHYKILPVNKVARIELSLANLDGLVDSLFQYFQVFEVKKT